MSRNRKTPTGHNAEPCQNCQHRDRHSEVTGCLALVGTNPEKWCPCDTYVPPVKTHADGIRERDQAIALVAEHTEPDWASAAIQAITDLADKVRATDERFSSDDVWDLLAARQIPAPREPRALGPILKAMGQARTVIVADGYTKSRRRHSTPITAYRAV